MLPRATENAVASHI